jgi:DNA-binding response OmpR family regulator
MKEVKARVKAVLRRASPSQVSHEEDALPSSSPEIHYETIGLNLGSKTATLDGVDVALTKLEFELLSLLLQNLGKVFSREELLSRCWPHDVYVLDRTVDVNITRLRKKIGRYGKQVKTRIGYGYCFEK